jgi:hypothetical protein
VSGVLGAADGMTTTIRDVLNVFPRAALVSCGPCGGTRWRRAGSGHACVICHPAPSESRLRVGTPMPVPQGWRAPRTTTARQWLEVVWALPERPRGERPGGAPRGDRAGAMTDLATRCTPWPIASPTSTGRGWRGGRSRGGDEATTDRQQGRRNRGGEVT